MSGSDKKVVPLPVGTSPGGVGTGTPLKPAPGHQLAAFARAAFGGPITASGRSPASSRPRSATPGGNHEPGLRGHRRSWHRPRRVGSHFELRPRAKCELRTGCWKSSESSHDSHQRGNREGPDVGSQYRSAIFTFGPEQQESQALADSRDAEQKNFVDRVTTEIAPAGPFWKAEDYHQQWDEKHGYESCPVPRHARARSGS